MVEEKQLQICKDALTNTDRTSVMLVCINGYRSDQPYGEIVNFHLAKGIGFDGIDDLVLAIDEVCDRVGAPPRTTEPRFLYRSGAEKYKKLPRNRNKPEKRKTADWMVPYMLRAKDVIVVEVMYRQNSSMQGRVLCRRGETKYTFFRSALELMRMLQEASKELCRQRL